LIVADTNLVAYLLIEGDQTELARSVRAADDVWVLPTLWRSEFLNVLTLAVRADVLDEASALRAWRLAIATFGRSEHEPAGEAVLATAIEKGLTAYDAQFVVTATDLDVLLVTSDRRMLAAAPDVAIRPSDFVEL
jgi:predicted nucleic acid-binding protein